MRIGLVCPYDLSKPGGVQAQVLDLAKHLDEGGDHAVVIGPGLPADIEGIDLGPSVTVPGNRSRVPLSVDPRITGAIQKGSTDLDLLHVHEPLMPMVSISALRVGLPVVATFHAAPGSVGTALYTLLRGQIPRLLGSNLRRVTAVSNTAARLLPSELGVTIVPNGVETSAFSSDVERIPGRVTFLGRDEKRKGLDVLLRAWDEVASALPTAELMVMGADRETSGITWLGRVDDAAKTEGLCSSTILAAPNLGGESFGVILVEGMASGAVVLASDLESFREVGSDVVRYFPVGDSAALAGSLIELLTNPETTGMLSKLGRERARRYDWSVVAARYREIYRSALS